MIHNLWYARLGNVYCSYWAGASAEADNRVYANGMTFLASGRANIAVLVGRRTNFAVPWLLSLLGRIGARPGAPKEPVVFVSIRPPHPIVRTRYASIFVIAYATKRR